MDLNKEKEYMKRIDSKIRNLELEKVRLEEKKENTRVVLVEIEKEMQELGITPANLDSTIDKLEKDVAILKEKIESALDKAEEDNL